MEKNKLAAGFPQCLKMGACRSKPRDMNATPMKHTHTIHPLSVWYDCPLTSDFCFGVKVGQGFIDVAGSPWPALITGSMFRLLLDCKHWCGTRAASPALGPWGPGSGPLLTSKTHTAGWRQGGGSAPLIRHRVLPCSPSGLWPRHRGTLVLAVGARHRDRGGWGGGNRSSVFCILL